MLYVTPLCPAGHLPLKGGDRIAATASPIVDVADGAEWKQPISPLEGEMSGRTEGRAKDRASPWHGSASIHDLVLRLRRVLHRLVDGAVRHAAVRAEDAGRRRRRDARHGVQRAARPAYAEGGDPHDDRFDRAVRRFSTADQGARLRLRRPSAHRPGGEADAHSPATFRQRRIARQG